MIHGLDTGFLVAAEVAEHPAHAAARARLPLPHCRIIGIIKRIDACHIRNNINSTMSERAVEFEELKERLREIAQDCVTKGPGYAQEGVVLREARHLIGRGDLEHEQLILEAWHCLFREGVFDWGHNLDNPGAPFFHQVVQQAATAQEAS